MRAFLHRLCWMSCLLVATIARAEPTVPAALEPWRGWVLQAQEFRACPLIAGKGGQAAGDFLCAWPGVLGVQADAGGASFRQRWRVEAESWIDLPGDAEHWPQQVSVDGKPAAVVDRDGPALRLAAGDHDIRGRIPWRERPQTLRVPQAIGLVALSIDGNAVMPVQRDGHGVTLGRAASAVPEADSIELHVHRRLADGVPAELTTQIDIEASGQAREELIGPVLPDGFMPLALDGDWPVRLEADGRLRVRVQPGADRLTLTARATAPLAAVHARLPSAPWPAQEIWSYAAAPRQRVTAAASALQVDPRQAQVPLEWLDLPAFALADGATLTIEERSRGLAVDARNRLSLEREMWLDFDGRGWFARDRLRGEMLQGWRFDAAAPFVLERASAEGGDEREALLVTRGGRPELSGVEWRTPAVDLAAGVRIAEAGSVLPITGWQDSFDHVSATVHLPAGYQLLGAPGADRADGSWIAAWTLLDVFVAALLVLFAWRLFGPLGALAAAAYLLLGYQEQGAPLWSLLGVIALALVARALPPGRLAHGAEWLRRGALLLLVLAALPFVAGQLRLALHPQLEHAEGASSDEFARAPAELGEMSAPKAVMAPAPPPPPSAPDIDYQKLETIPASGSSPLRADLIERYSESTVVQTGGGEPAWQSGRRYELAWSGPVLPAQTVRLLIAPPWLVRSLRIVLVALLAWLVVRLVHPGARTPLARAATPLLVGALALTTAPGASAQGFPPDGLLNELRTQLTQAPECAPDCATIATVEASAHGDELRVVLEAHAAERIALPLPNDEMHATLRSARVDGVEQDAIARDAGVPRVTVPRGVHRVELVFAAAADRLALAFPLRPKRVQFSGDDWQASGLVDARLLTETLTLTRARASTAAPAASGAQQFAPFVRVERQLTLGLDWAVDTMVKRLAPQQGGFTLELPTLAGEHVLTAGLKQEGGHVTVALGDGEATTRWSSRLDKGATLSLRAPPLDAHAEVWRVLVNPRWHVDFSGVPGVAMGEHDDARDYRLFEFHPLPGETLELAVTRPDALPGTTRAIDAVRLGTTVGQRAVDATLVLRVRASQGGEQVVTLPAEAEVLGVSRSGTPLNLRAQDGRLSLPVVPGEQAFEVRFREHAPPGFLTRTPVVALGLPAANLDLDLELPADRWLLATIGPPTGPAVLYWSSLVVMLLVAAALARTRRTSLKLRHWILLGLGFSTFSWLALLVVVAWLFALDWRARSTPSLSPRRFNAIQVGLAALTVIAVLCLATAIPQGLLGAPDMQVTGNGSSGQALRWFADRSVDALPVARAISLPLWVYKLAMLGWALWVANALVGWLRDGFAAWTHGGYWRSAPKPVVDLPATPPPVA